MHRKTNKHQLTVQHLIPGWKPTTFWERARDYLVGAASAYGIRL